jgi:F-type H+-transporting ATPase subunit b
MIQIFFLLARAWAEEGGAEAAEHAVSIPWMQIVAQAFNFFFLVGLLVYLLHAKVKEHFANRAREYKLLVERAEEARAEAERGKIEIEQRLKKLELSAAQTVEQARAEAAELTQRLTAEARTLAAKMEQEAVRSSKVEVEKAKAELRAELLEKALAASSETLKKSLGTTEQKKLQNEFAEKIQVVGG